MKALSALILANICIGTVGILIKKIGPNVPIMTVSFLRVFLGFVFLAAVMPFTKQVLYKPKRRDLFHYSVVGLLFALDYTVYNTAVSLTTVSNAIVFVSTSPLWVYVLSYLFLRERIAHVALVSFAITILGIGLMNPMVTGAMAGNVLALFDGLIYAILFVFMRYEEKHHRLETIFWYMFFATLFLSPMPFVYGFGEMDAALPWILALGFFSTGLGYLLLVYSLEKIMATVASLVSSAVRPLVGVVLAITLLHEVLTTQMWLGAALIISAGALLHATILRVKECPGHSVFHCVLRLRKISHPLPHAGESLTHNHYGK